MVREAVDKNGNPEQEYDVEKNGMDSRNQV